MDNKSGDGNRWRQHALHPEEQRSMDGPPPTPLAAVDFDAFPAATYSPHAHDDQDTSGYGVDHEESRLRNEAHLTHPRPAFQDLSLLHPRISYHRDGSGSPWTRPRQYEHDSAEWSSHTPQSSLFEDQPTPSMEDYGRHESASQYCTSEPHTEEYISFRHGACTPVEGVDLVGQRNGPWSPMNPRIGVPAEGIATRANRAMMAAMTLDVYHSSEVDLGQMNRTPIAVLSSEYDVECPTAVDNWKAFDCNYHGDDPSVSMPPFAAPPASTQDNHIDPLVVHGVAEGNPREEYRGQENEARPVDHQDPYLR